MKRRNFMGLVAVGFASMFIGKSKLNADELFKGKGIDFSQIRPKGPSLACDFDGDVLNTHMPLDEWRPCSLSEVNVNHCADIVTHGPIFNPRSFEPGGSRYQIKL